MSKSDITEVKLKLKDPLLSFQGKPLKNTDNINNLLLQNPTLSKQNLLEKCPDILVGEIIPEMLFSIETKDTKEKLKIFRWATKIQDKIITNKGELELDLNQVTELFDFFSKSHSHKISVIGPVLEIFEGMKKDLTKTN